jgi:pilus assembly protein CpaB
MNRNTRTLIVVAIAIVMASIASFGVYVAVRSMPVREVEVARMQAVVAAKALVVGTMVTKDDVKLVAWPAANPIPGAFTDTTKVVNRGLIVAVGENEPITESKLAAVGAGAGLPPTIPEGMRAVSIRVNEIVGVAGFVIPGTRVDVLVNISSDDGTRETISRIVLSNVQVLASGTRYDQQRATQEGKAIPTSVVTLVLTPEDVEKLALAADEGKLTLALRNPLDTAEVTTKGARRAELFGEPSPPPVKKVVQGRTVLRAAAPPPPPPPPKVYTVETIRAAKRGEEEVR